MVQSKVLRPEWLPAVALSSALAALMLLWSPPVGDLAAQVFRTELFQQAGMAIWNGSWYGGHYTLTYSLLFPPLGALLGPQVVGGLAVVSSSYLFDRLVRDRWGVEARWATLWFAAGVVTLLADGQLTFALGVAFGLATLRCLQVGHGRLAVLAAAGCALSSPVAGAFLAGVVFAGVWERGSRLNRAALGAGALALALTIVPNLAFPEPGQFPFAFSSFIAIPLWCAGALYVIRHLPEERQLRRVIVGYLLASTLIWLTPNALGGNAVRLGALFGGPVLAAVVLSRRPHVARWMLALVLAGSLYWQLTASVTQIARSVGDPSTTPAYFQPAATWLRAHGGEGMRIEVPPTANHWESAYLAPKFELARGWLRQLDTTRDDIFYDEGLNNRNYSAWLRGNAISYVALPDAPLDYSSVAESHLIAAAPPYLKLRFHSEHWRIYQVVDPKPLVAPIGAGRARTLSIGRQGFALDVTKPGQFLVRVNFTPYWTISQGAGCILRDGDWTVARTAHTGVFRVKADFSLGSAWNAVTGARKTC
jgi:multisubunit Na+/H+ antiporter MnhE subunit